MCRIQTTVKTAGNPLTAPRTEWQKGMQHPRHFLVFQSCCKERIIVAGQYPHTVRGGSDLFGWGPNTVLFHLSALNLGQPLQCLQYNCLVLRQKQRCLQEESLPFKQDYLLIGWQYLVKARDGSYKTIGQGSFNNNNSFSPASTLNRQFRGENGDKRQSSSR